MRTGIVKFFNVKNKFGFITDDETKQDYYVHIKDIAEPITEGDKVSFELEPSKRGFSAVAVKKRNP